MMKEFEKIIKNLEDQQKRFTEQYVAGKVALLVFDKMLEQVGTAKPLKNNYRKIYDEYMIVLDGVQKDIIEAKLPKKDEREELDNLEMEKLWIECFCRFLQESKKWGVRKR